MLLRKKVLHHQIYATILKYNFSLLIPNLICNFDAALEGFMQNLKQQYFVLKILCEHLQNGIFLLDINFGIFKIPHFFMGFRIQFCF